MLDTQLLEDFHVQIKDGFDSKEIAPDQFLLSIEVRTLCPVSVPHLDKLHLIWPTKRGSKIHISDFSQNNDELSFMVHCEMHRSFLSAWPINPEYQNQMIATTFADYCFKMSDGTTAQSILEVDTRIPEYAILGDLTWCLPSKFADDIIDALYVMNAGLVEGILEQAVLIGPFVRKPILKEEKSND